MLNLNWFDDSDRVKFAQKESDKLSESKWLTSEQLRDGFVGKTHFGLYRDYLEQYGGVEFTETYRLDGSVFYEGGDITTTGEWTIQGNQICFDYDNDNFIPGCFLVKYDNGCFYSYDANLPTGGKLVISERWGIRSYIIRADGRAPNCAKPELVG